MPSATCSISRLPRSDFFGNSLTGDLPASMGSLTSLTQLILTSNTFGSSFPEWLPNLPLEHLDMHNTGLAGTLPCSLTSHTALRVLWLGSNSFPGPLPDCLSALPTSLTQLDLSANALTGTLPAWMGRFNAMDILQLSFNSFTQALPHELGSLTSVQRLYLQQNQFTGSVPETLASLTGLQTLGLSDNRLDGTLPPSFSSLTSITELYLLNSGLCGDVPTPHQPDDGSLPSCLAPPTSRRRSEIILIAVLFVAAAALAGAFVYIRRRRRAAIKPPGDDADALLAGLLAEATDEEEAGAGVMAVEASATDVRLEERLGEGGFGTVFSASWNGTRVAVKLLKPRGVMLLRHASTFTANWHSALSAPLDPTSGAPPFQSVVMGSLSSADAILHEVSILAQLRHPHIIATYGYVRSPPMLIMEIASGGSLAALLARSTLASLPWLARLRILTGVACGVEYLHKQSPPIIHLDLKSANVLLSEGLVPRVSDFGLSLLPSARAAAQQRIKVGTPLYMSPEMACGEVITLWEAVDAFGFGTIALDCCAQPQDETPFSTANETSLRLDNLSVRLSALLCGSGEEDVAAAVVGEGENKGGGDAMRSGTQAAPPRLARLIHACLELHARGNVSQHEINIHARRAQMPQQVGSEHAVASGAVAGRVAHLAGKGDNRSGVRLNLGQPPAQATRAASHRRGLAATRVQDDQVEVAARLLHPSQHVLHTERLVVQQAVLRHLLHRDEVVLVVRLHAVACGGTGRRRERSATNRSSFRLAHPHRRRTPLRRAAVSSRRSPSPAASGPGWPPAEARLRSRGVSRARRRPPRRWPRS